MSEGKQPTSFRLSNDAKKLLEELAKKYSISQAAMLEVIIREKAKAEGIKVN